MNYKLKTILVFLGLFIGVLMTSQLIADVPVNSTFPLDQIKAKEELLKSLNDEQVGLQSKIVLLRQQIADINKNHQLSEQEGILQRLENLKNTVGLKNITASGLEIALADGLDADRANDESVSLYLVHAADLRDIINVLRAAHAKGIAINNQRILVTTPIISVGNSILINNFNLAPPYTIGVAGDTELLLQRLQDPDVLPDLKTRVAKKQIEMTIQTKHLNIPIYNGAFRDKNLQK